MSYDICVGGVWRLSVLESVEIYKSVDSLTATATVTVPAVEFGVAIGYEEFVKIGDTISIKLGYDETLVNEFEGYIQRIDTDDDTLTFNCEDAMYLTRKAVPDKQFLNTDIKKVATYCLNAIGLTGINCTYNIKYEKFVISRARAFDVLKKLKAETGACIYLKDGVLQIHPPYIEKGGDVIYDFAVNIEASELKYRNKDDRIFEIDVEGVGLDGKKKKITVGTTGGEKRSIKVTSPMSDAELRKRGNAELDLLCYDGYEGTITGWLVPFVAPTYSARIRDKDYEYKTGVYYVTAVNTTFDENGGVRKISLGKKLS